MSENENVIEEVDPPIEMGWVRNLEAVQEVLDSVPMPLFGSSAPHLVGSGRGKTTLLYKAIKTVAGDYPKYPAQEIGDCFPAGTTVLGERTRPIEDVQVGDRVWTGEGRMTTVVSTRAITTVRPLVEVRPVGGLPITCTQDHQFLVYRMQRVGHRRVTPNFYKRAVAGGKGFSTQAVIDSFEGRSPEWVATGDLRDTDCLLTPVHLERMAFPASPGGLLDSEAGRFVIGYFLGNGYAGGGSAEWAFPEGSANIARVVAGLEAHGFLPKLDGHGDWKGVRVRAHSRELVAWLSTNFYDGKTKSYPGWLVGDHACLEGLIAADGHDNGHTSYLDSTSLSIVFAAYATLTIMGLDPIIAEVVRSKGTYANAKPLYRLSWVADKTYQYVWRDEQFLARPVRSTRFIEGPTTVYDIGVADAHHSFLANGHAAHNCVSQAFGHGGDLLACVEIAIGNEHEEFKETATEAIYGTCRVDIGGQRGSRSDGAVGAWASKAVVQFGTVSREVVGAYSGKRSKDWGATGVPADIKAKMAEHKIGTSSLVSTYEELEDALYNGYPVVVCSDQGFTMVRDAEGFCQPKGVWMHALLAIAVRADNRPGACILQSWGNNVPSGPTTLEQPDYSFWADKKVVSRMLSQGDSWSLSSFNGYPARGDLIDLADFLMI